MSADFPDYAVKETKDAVASRRTFTGDQVKALDDILWNLASDPARFGPISTRTSTGQLLYRDPAFGVEVLYRVDASEKILYLFHFSAPMAPRRTIFISYSHQDTEWLELFRKFLGVLENAGIIKFWDDSAIKTGEPWEESIRRALDTACAALLLVSQDFLVSKFITTYELPRILSDAQREGKKVFWLQVSPSTVFNSHKEITVFQALIDDPKISLAELKPTRRQKLLVEISAKLQAALSEN